MNNNIRNFLRMQRITSFVWLERLMVSIGFMVHMAEMQIRHMM